LNRHAAIALLAATLAAYPAAAQQITGAGATFPAPVYQKWGEAAKAASGIELNYQAIGSGGGINQITNRTVDFGATDAPLNAERLATGNLMQFPTVMGAIVLTINVPGVPDKELKLTGEIVADIFQGKIARWNDRRLVELNPTLNLPNIPIAPVYRADASGTTFQFTDYLGLVSPDWKTRIGSGNTPMRS
jgi:phosphate transport system substrate-binding protein